MNDVTGMRVNGTAHPPGLLDGGEHPGRTLSFIINPKARCKPAELSRLARRILPPRSFDYEFSLTEAPGHAEQLASEAVRRGVDVVVAVGGDGTVNEVGRALLGAAGTALAILPRGSGNGLARHLRIPLDAGGALRRLLRPRIIRIDVGHINGHPFLCTAGLGFDAHISRLFASSRQRGLATYLRIALQEYGRYRSRPIQLIADGEAIASACYVLAFANASQYGNNASIAPSASVEDGLLDMCLIESMPLRRAIRVAYGLAAGDLPKSKAATYNRLRDILIKAPEPLGFHVDGEFIGEATTFGVGIAPLAINVCV